MAEQERKKNKVRQSEGIDVTMKKGVKFGRPRFEIEAGFVAVYVEWREKKQSRLKELWSCYMRQYKSSDFGFKRNVQKE
ncbi:hypothetical protein [Listeria booriae]|uniref:hypothetical protein n=1 Tax=Listeria booriae TaxID=1552123 RepID=UPI0016239FEC|nr:hypothetical protein [Listeria booriae]MBC2173869.1 hypothetical protein [Listeria booriae]